MRIATFAMILATAVATGAQPPVDEEPAPTLDLMPVPAQVELGAGVFTIAEDFSVSIDGNGATPRLRQGVQRMLRRLSDRTGLFFDPATFLQITERENPVMVVSASRSGELELGEDESYRLTVSSIGVRVEAETDIGALRGLETFLQLIVRDNRGVVVPEVAILDAPRFPWRGLMIDSSRHFMPVEVIKRNLDGMAAVKLNVLHWHLVDDQGFRVECLAFPKLHRLGSDGKYYTRHQIREVIEYAALRGIRVVPEFDLPGHATSWLVGHPELASKPGPYEIERGWGIYDPTIDPTRRGTYRFLERFFAEMAELFDDEFIHIGGDENTGKHWAENPEIVAYMNRHGFDETLELQRHFNERVLKILDRHGKRMIGWDEIFQPGLPTSIVIQSWRGRESLYAAARRGYSGMLSNGYYIDLIQPTDFHYLNDPLPEDAPLSPEEAKLVLGGEATMWAEYVTPETVDSRIWPRTAAIAERLWSPGRVRDVEDMYRRLDRISLMLEELGLQHERNQQMMLRRLCGCRDVAALEVLVGAIEPVKIYRRGALRRDTPRPYTQFSPLTRLVDAARPDAAPARVFRRSVGRLIEGGFTNPHNLAAARSSLRLWQATHAALVETFHKSPPLTEMASLSLDLSEVSMIGLEALEITASGGTAPGDWLQPRLDRLEQARAPRGEAELMIVDPVRDLVCAAVGPAARQEPACQAKQAVAEGDSH
jgi:hexosaminidase